MTWRILTGDVRDMLPTIPAKSVQCVVTSPPYYGLRNYGVDGQIGLESTLTTYIETMVDVFRLVRDVLADDGVLWLNIGDSYASAWPCNRRSVIGNPSLDNGKRENRPPRLPDGTKEKDLMMVPARLALALQADGWYLRSDIIWHKPNPMPESVQDRPTSAHEHIFLLTKSPRYYYDADAIRTEPTSITTKMPDGWDTGAGGHGSFHRDGREKGKSADKQACIDLPAVGANARNVWSIPTVGYSEAHFATFPPEIPRRCILAGSREGDLILDPFAGAGTTLLVADRLGRNAIGVELNPDYVAMATKRIYNDAPLFQEVPA